MNICICGSLAFVKEMAEVKQQLELLGHEVYMPPVKVEDSRGGEIGIKERYEASKQATADDTWVWDMREKAMRRHFEKVEWSDAVVIVNIEKNGVLGYIGANTLLEMGLAFHLKKPIYLLNPIPDISYKEEILGMKPIVLDQDLSKIS